MELENHCDTVRYSVLHLFLEELFAVFTCNNCFNYNIVITEFSKFF